MGLDTNFKVENNPAYKIMPRSNPSPYGEASWPGLEEDTRARAVLQNNKGGDLLPRARSFADMVKKPTMVKCDENNLKPEADNNAVNKKVEKNMYNDKKKLEDRLKLSKNNTAMTSILKNQKVVVNQISASTYGRIGKSDDESKYVMSKINANLEEKHRPPVVRHELEVEFVEPEFHFSSNDDGFEVEFSANAAPRPGKNVVNKISAMTFQQIGKTSDNEKYVMKPKSWSSVVGKGLKTLPDQNRNSPKDDISETQKEPKGEPSVHDKIRAKMKDKEDEKRKEMLKPQTSKLRFISSDILDHVKQFSTSNKDHNLKDKGIKFLDEEYPDLGLGQKVHIGSIKKEKVISSEIRDENGKLTEEY